MNASKAGQVYDMHFRGFETVYLDAPEAPSKKGDINGDGEINASDVTALINKILSSPTTPMSCATSMATVK